MLFASHLHHMIAPSIVVAIMQMSRLSWRPASFIHFTDSPARNLALTRAFGKSLLVPRVVPHRYVPVEAGLPPNAPTWRSCRRTRDGACWGSWASSPSPPGSQGRSSPAGCHDCCHSTRWMRRSKPCLSRTDTTTSTPGSRVSLACTASKTSVQRTGSWPRPQTSSVTGQSRGGSSVHRNWFLEL